MAFILKQTASYFWPVTIELPTSGGRFEKQTFDAEFKRTSQERINAIMADARDLTTNDIAVCREMMVGWRGVSDDSGEIPFSEEALSMLLDIPTVANSAVTAWMESLAGAKRKN